jgi:hypothetical protein
MFGGDLFYFLFNEVNSTEQAAHVAVGEWICDCVIVWNDFEVIKGIF